MKLATFRKIAVFGILTFAISPGATAAKPKYGAQATLLSASHEYIQKQPAPDYWAISPYYVSQMNEKACSLASVTMVVNAAREGLKLTADDELATQEGVLKKTKDEEWQRAVGPVGKGVTLEELGKYVAEALKAYGVNNVHIEVVHADDEPAAKKKLHETLVANEKSANDFIIINFIQGVYTGDADVGHIAPIAAYDAAKKRALIMDPDRQWYEPYWVSEDILLKGMATKDPASGKNRGYVYVKIEK